MCELLGMVASQPADVLFSFTGLAMRGGQTGPHADGWGLALYDGVFARLFLEEHPAYSSPLARFLRENPILSKLAIAHVRKLTRGVACIQNTHPFARVVNGRHLVFAHNGTLPNVRSRPLRYQSTLGTTDSEHAFCVLLEAMRERFGTNYPAHDPLAVGQLLYEVGNELGQDGVFNFLFADGKHLFARCGDSLYATVRRAPFSEVTLVDAEVSMNFGDHSGGAADLRMAAVATMPLTRNETWIRGTPGTLWLFADGDLVKTWDPPEGYVEASPQITPQLEQVCAPTSTSVSSSL